MQGRVAATAMGRACLLAQQGKVLVQMPRHGVISDAGWRRRRPPGQERRGEERREEERRGQERTGEERTGEDRMSLEIACRCWCWYWYVLVLVLVLAHVLVLACLSVLCKEEST